jgi:hypothetical protein
MASAPECREGGLTTRPGLGTCTACVMYRKSKRPFSPRPPGPTPPPAVTLCLRRLPCPPQRPGARRSAVQHGFGWCWTGAAGWGRVGPLGLLEGWGGHCNGISNAQGVRYTATARTAPSTVAGHEGGQLLEQFHWREPNPCSAIGPLVRKGVDKIAVGVLGQALQGHGPARYTASGAPTDCADGLGPGY